ncbi:MAG TPA: PDZ domain-containing protein [Verrucomicrobiae bacterium]|nr:PDZ domain-containing protein [Verrucomicrobiae bacterium]
MTRSRIWGATALAAALVLAGAWFTAASAGDDGKKDVHKKVVIFRSGGSWLGVQIADVDMDRGKELGLKDVHGAEVQSVSEGSPAEEAGIKEGDVITEYQGTRIEGVAQLTRLVRETPAGRTARVEVFRNGSSKDLTVQMKEREHDGDDEDLPGHMQIWSDDGDGDGKMTWFHTPTPPEPPDINLQELEGLQDKLAIMGLPGGRPRLGVTVDSVGKQLADYFGVKQGSGVLVTSVGKGSAAEAAGIKAGDVIVKVDDESVSDAGDLHMAMRHRRDKALTLTVVRERRETTIKVAAPPEDETPAPGTPSAHKGAKPADIQRQVDRAMRDAQRAMLDSDQVRKDVLASQRAAYAEAMRAVHQATQLNEEQRQQIRDAIHDALQRLHEQTGSVESGSDAYDDAVEQGIEEGVEGGQDDEDGRQYEAPDSDDSDRGATYVDSGQSTDSAQGTEEQRAEIRRAVEEARRARLEGQSSDR